MFQLYVNKDRKKSEELVRHVEELGVKAIFVTVDAAGRGKRESDERLRVDEVAFNPLTGEKSTTGKRGGGLTKIVGQFIDQALTWEDLKWLRSLTKLPILLKGVMGAEDARLAMEYKVDGILLSNHGGKHSHFLLFSSTTTTKTDDGGHHRPQPRLQSALHPHSPRNAQALSRNLRPDGSLRRRRLQARRRYPQSPLPRREGRRNGKAVLVRFELWQ
jgi:hypothetical protein